MKKRSTRFIWGLLPTKSLSRLTGKIARHSLSKWLIPFYIRLFNIDMSPVKKELKEFDSLLDFFVRELHTDARPINPEVDQVVSPVDGVIVQIGDIEDGTLIQAKGITYSLAMLLENHEKYVSTFHGGKFVTVYLSPRDYHRIHMPVEGTVTESVHIPGKLYPVNEMGLNAIVGLFTRNERIISYIESHLGHVAVVKVGATNVGSIKVTYDVSVSSNQKKRIELQQKAYNPGVLLSKGAELGRFEFGSTVILLFEPNQVEWTVNTQPGTYVKMGESIAKKLY